MSLICFRNGSLAREQVKMRHQLSWNDFDSEGLARTSPSNGGRVILPFASPEITPRVDSNDFVTIGWDEPPTSDEWVRGVLEGQFMNMKLHSDWLGVETAEILITGGASENDGIAQIVADVFGKKVRRLSVSGSAGLGAAIRAACSKGLDLNHLEKVFSGPEKGRDVRPHLENTLIYNKLGKVFIAALEKRFKLPYHQAKR